MKLLICDDHSLVAEGIELMLQKGTEIYEIHLVTSGISALEFLKQDPVDVLLLDISMPEMSGLEVLDEIRSLEINVNILMLTMHNEIQYIKKALAKGAKGYVLKTTSKSILVEAIDKVANGETYVDDKLTSVLINDLTERPNGKKSEAVNLTPREIDILKLIAENKKTKEIAELLFISLNTVQSHKKNLYSKLNIHSVSELVTYAYQNGFVKL